MIDLSADVGSETQWSADMAIAYRLFSSPSIKAQDWLRGNLISALQPGKIYILGFLRRHTVLHTGTAPPGASAGEIQNMGSRSS
ncbi:hypothetical protein HJB88_31365 [Rhizobium sp. NZLR5]|nr:hypothetical protein [Rhizobium sp. NZLR5]